MKHNHTEFNPKDYNKLKTLAEKAAYLLKCKMNTREALKFPPPCFQAIVGSVELPVWGEDEKQTIEQAVLWLKESSLNYKILSEAGI